MKRKVIKPKPSVTMTTNQGVPIGDNANSLTAGNEGPTLLEDSQLIEKLAHFDRERIPERVVHARGAAAHGIFTTNVSMKAYTKMHLFQEPGIVTPVFARFSTVIHGHSSPETLRDPRGFSVKFYTEEGNWDFVGNNLPVFFIRDAIKFPDVIHALKPDPQTNIQDPTRYWDFFTQTPESTAMLIHLFGPEGIPVGYRNIRGSSVHAYKWTNAEGRTHYVKLRWIPKQGIKNMTEEEAARVQATDFNHASRDLFASIQRGEFPEWDLFAQILPPSSLDLFPYNALDATKDWFESDVPFTHIGTMKLNRNPQNVFAETENVAFSPGNFVPGISASEDKMLQGRLFSYPDTHRHRIGTNFAQLPINAPKHHVANYQRDGHMPFVQQASTTNYEPNRFADTPKPDMDFNNVPQPITGGWSVRQPIDRRDDFNHAGAIYRHFSSSEQAQLHQNLTKDLRKVTDQAIVEKAVYHFFLADEQLGNVLAQNLAVNINRIQG
ncbi:MAG: catalase [Bacilli bacterium]